VDRTILWINHYPIEDSAGFDPTYPKDSPLSSGWHYPAFNNWDMLRKPNLPLSFVGVGDGFVGEQKKNGRTFAFKLTIVLTDVQLTLVFSEYRKT